MQQFLGLDLGVMQGRLLPKYNGRFQAHPVGYWQNEFEVARDIGFKHIEFILDHNDALINPLLNAEGVTEIKKHIANTGVKVRSICADYFMEAPLHSADESVAQSSFQVMTHLMKSVGPLETECIVLPCVDQSSVSSNADKERLIRVLQKLSKNCEELNLTIALEMDLNPDEFHFLLKELPETITVNYDTGNSAALGFDIEEEFDAYGHRISDIHLKDRELGGGSVKLGKGNTDFKKVIQSIKKINYNGIIVMQAYRDDEGVGILKAQLNTLQNIESAYQ